MLKFRVMDTEELVGAKDAIYRASGYTVEGHPEYIAELEGVQLLDMRWVKRQDWYKMACSGLEENDLPSYIIRVVSLTNTGYNWILDRKGEVWKGLDNLQGNSPAFNGCPEYLVDGESTVSNEAYDWVHKLVNDMEGLWF
jgi:hypothetical protein